MTEEIKNDIDKLNGMIKIKGKCGYEIIGGCSDLRRLEQENKELKETIKQYCQWLDEEREDNDKLQKVYQNDHCDLLNYRSALEEIRICINKCRHSYCDSNCEYWGNCKGNYNIDNILDKINEVLG